MKINTFLCFIGVVISLSSCENYSQLIEPLTNAFPGSSWQLIRIDTVGAGTVFLSQADTILLTFYDSRHISGSSLGLCGNTYFGVYSVTSADSIRVDSLATTKIYCPNSQYHYYYDLLREAEYYQRVGAQLKVYCDHRSRRLVFRRVS